MSGRATHPTPEAFCLAAEWLDCYEGEEHEPGEIKLVADWLRTQASEDELRAAARGAGVPVGRLRAKLAASQRTGAESSDKD